MEPPTHPLLTSRYLGPATVSELDGPRIRIDLPGDSGSTWADLAVAAPARVAPGDTVLAIGDDLDQYYVIGILRQERPTDGPELIHDAASGTTKLVAASGNLQLVAPEGRVEIVAAQGIHLSSLQDVQVSARREIRCGILGRAMAALHLRGDEAELAARRLEISAERSRFELGRSRVESETLEAEIGRARVTGHRLETAFRTVRSTADNVYRAVKGLWQLTAGRSRTVVEGAIHQKSDRWFSRTDGDTRIQGDKINLG